MLDRSRDLVPARQGLGEIRVEVREVAEQTRVVPVLVELAAEGEGWIGSFTTTNNVNPEDGRCFDHTEHGAAVGWDAEAGELEVVLSARPSCGGSRPTRRRACSAAWPRAARSRVTTG